MFIFKNKNEYTKLKKFIKILKKQEFSKNKNKILEKIKIKILEKIKIQKIKSFLKLSPHRP